ncbi:PKD domain-containing protein [Microbulbifer sp. JMSA004]|uniref:PKD domain-containing protein n=1 Tax=unclassified Microbulbifer TaxID=2619833 RepID=UPI00403954F3
MKLKLLSKFFVLPSITFLCASAVSEEVQFQPAEIYSTGSRAEAVAVADMNNDGRDDVVVSTSSNFDPENDFKLKIFLQDEYGQLQEPVDYLLDGDGTILPKSIDVGDLNGDGLLDIAVAFGGERIDIFSQLHDGTLVLSESISSSRSSKIAVADVTGDGIDDIVGIGSEEVGLAIYAMKDDPINNRLSYIYLMEPDDSISLALKDMNRDGVEDVITVVKQSERSALAVMLSESNGSFAPIQYYEIDEAFSVNNISVDDLNSDGRADIWLSVDGDDSDTTEMVFYQKDNGILENTIFAPVENAYGILLAYDLNNDLSSEFIAVPLQGNTISIHRKLSSDRMLEHFSYDIPEDSYNNFQGIDVGDINSDGIPDVVIASPSTGLVLLKGNTQGTNLAPLADAGDDQETRKDQIILLDGTHSSDRDGSIIDYRWRQLSGSPVTLNDTSNGFATFLAPLSKYSYLGMDESLVFELEIEDNENIVSVDKAIITLDGNIPPTAITNTFQVVGADEVVTLNGSSSRDLFGEIISYEWKQVAGEPVELEQESETTVSFSSPVLISSYPFISFEILEFELVVTDNEGLESSVIAQVNVQKLAPPMAIPVAAQTVYSGEEVLLDGRMSSDADGEIISYNWRSLSDIDVVNYPNGTASFIAPIISAESRALLTFELEVEDNDGLKSTSMINVTVERNMPPIVPSDLMKIVQPNFPVTLDASGAFDRDGEIVSYQWQQVSGPSVAIANSNSISANFTAPSEQATLVFAVTVIDDDGESSTFDTSVRVYELIPSN